MYRNTLLQLTPPSPRSGFFYHIASASSDIYTMRHIHIQYGTTRHNRRLKSTNIIGPEDSRLLAPDMQGYFLQYVPQLARSTLAHELT